MSTQVAKIEPKEIGVIEFVPMGMSDKIKLSVSIVQKLLCKPTRSGAMPSVADALKFITLCQARKLNPFEGDAFLVGYDGKNGPEFSLITAHQTFLKRAEANEAFDGMESGVIVKDAAGNLVDRVGDFTLEDDELMGGWAKVHVKGRKLPTERRLKLSSFRKQTQFWDRDPAGMIVKTAEADALRSTFPTVLGGLYTEGDNRSAIDITPQQIPETASAPPPVVQPLNPPHEAPVVVDPPPGSGQSELESIVIGAGFNFDQFIGWGKQSGNINEDAEYPGFDDIPQAIAARLVKAKSGLVKQLRDYVLSQRQAS